MVTGEWMVEFYATWCSACQHFKPIWSDFSNAVSSKNVKVAAVDIEQYPSLSGRFHVSSLPTIYYVRDGAFRVYDGERSLNALKNYIAHEDWKKTEPMSPYSAPDSFLMSLNSVAFDLSEILRSAYTLLHEQYGWPTWLIYILLGIAIILVGALIGFVTVVIVDSVMAVISKIFSRADGKNKKGLVEIDAEKLLKSKKQENSTDTSPTAQQTKDEKESSESDESDGSDDKLNTSDVVQEKDEQEEQTTTDQTVRQRRLEK